jgi:hypothetical protein
LTQAEALPKLADSVLVVVDEIGLTRKGMHVVDCGWVYNVKSAHSSIMGVPRPPVDWDTS